MNEPRRREQGTQGTALWLHLVALVLVVGLAVVAGRVLGTSGSEAPSLGARVTLAIRSLAATLYVPLPALAGLAVGLPRSRGGLARQAAWLTGAVLAAMLLIDLFAPLARPPSLQEPAVGRGVLWLRPRA